MFSLTSLVGGFLYFNTNYFWNTGFCFFFSSLVITFTYPISVFNSGFFLHGVFLFFFLFFLYLLTFYLSKSGIFFLSSQAFFLGTLFVFSFFFSLMKVLKFKNLSFFLGLNSKYLFFMYVFFMSILSIGLFVFFPLFMLESFSFFFHPSLLHFFLSLFSLITFLYFYSFSFYVFGSGHYDCSSNFFEGSSKNNEKGPFYCTVLLVYGNQAYKFFSTLPYAPPITLDSKDLFSLFSVPEVEGGVTENDVGSGYTVFVWKKGNTTLFILCLKEESPEYLCKFIVGSTPILFTSKDTLVNYVFEYMTSYYMHVISMGLHYKGDSPLNLVYNWDAGLLMTGVVPGQGNSSAILDLNGFLGLNSYGWISVADFLIKESALIASLEDMGDPSPIDKEGVFYEGSLCNSKKCSLFSTQDGGSFLGTFTIPSVIIPFMTWSSETMFRF